MYLYMKKASLVMLVLMVGMAFVTGPAVAAEKTRNGGRKPNILVIWGDDIGWNNPSCLPPRHDGLPDAQH